MSSAGNYEGDITVPNHPFWDLNATSRTECRYRHRICVLKTHRGCAEFTLLC
jgi:hypothetical protein